MQTLSNLPSLHKNTSGKRVLEKMEKVKAALHNHLTRFGKMKPFNKIIDNVHGKLGPNGILGLVHFGNDWYKKIAESTKGYEKIDLGNCFYVPEKDNLVCINGQEVLARTKEGVESHLLILGQNKEVRLKNGRTIEDTIKEAKDNGGIIGIDHPFSPYGAGPDFKIKTKLIEEIHFVETHNNLAGIFPFANYKAEEFYRWAKKINPNLGSIISDDGHSLLEAGRNWMKIPRLDLRNSDAVRESLKKGLIIERKPSEENRTGILSSYYFGSIHAGVAVYSRIIEKFGWLPQIDFNN